LSVWSFPNVLLFLVGGASPLLAGVTLAAVEGGKAGLYELWWRLIDVWRISLRWWVVIFLFWPVFDVLVAGGAVVFGVVDRPLAIAWDKVTAPRTMAFMLLLSFVFPAVEEIGLRGYWLDKLQERFEPPVAGAIVGGQVEILVWHVLSGLPSLPAITWTRLGQGFFLVLASSTCRRRCSKRSWFGLCPFWLQ